MSYEVSFISVIVVFRLNATFGVDLILSNIEGDSGDSSDRSFVNIILTKNLISFAYILFFS